VEQLLGYFINNYKMWPLATSALIAALPMQAAAIDLHDAEAEARCDLQ